MGANFIGYCLSTVISILKSDMCQFTFISKSLDFRVNSEGKLWLFKFTMQ